MYDPIERMALTRLNHYMHMVRHDAPRKKAVPILVEVKQRSFDDLCDLRSAKPTSTPAGIEPFIGLSKVVR